MSTSSFFTNPPPFANTVTHRLNGQFPRMGGKKGKFSFHLSSGAEAGRNRGIIEFPQVRTQGCSAVLLFLVAFYEDHFIVTDTQMPA